MNAFQKELLSLLSEFDGICNEHGILYSALGGTLLGAVRERAMIPWDDDIDVGMTRQNYKKLASLLSENKCNYKLVQNFTGGAAQFVKIDCSVEQKIKASIDVFVYDYISENSLAQNLKCIGIIFLQAIQKNRKTLKLTSIREHGKLKVFLYMIICYCGLLLPRDKKRHWYEKFAQFAFDGEKTLIFLSNDSYKYLKRIIPSYYMDNLVRLPFENIYISASAYYDEILKLSYGNDYLIPVRDGGVSDRHERFREMLFQNE